MPAHEHLSGEQLSMFLPADYLMNEVGTIEGEDVHEPFSKATQKTRYQGMSHIDAANKTTNVVQQKRLENAVRHDESQFGTDPKNIEEGETLFESIARKGIVNPVTLSKVNNDKKKWVILNGQHRVVAAYDINNRMEVPVEYSEKIVLED